MLRRAGSAWRSVGERLRFRWPCPVPTASSRRGPSICRAARRWRRGGSPLRPRLCPEERVRPTREHDVGRRQIGVASQSFSTVLEVARVEAPPCLANVVAISDFRRCGPRCRGQASARGQRCRRQKWRIPNIEIEKRQRPAAAAVGSQGWWRKPSPRPAVSQNYHHDGGRLFSSSWRILEPYGGAGFKRRRPSTVSSRPPSRTPCRSRTYRKWNRHS
jgi:hypothetical protein